MVRENRPKVLASVTRNLGVLFITGSCLSAVMLNLGLMDSCQVKLQKHNTEAHGIKYKSGFHCAARILKIQGVCSIAHGY
ncbi:hypothetical protein Dimus_032732 [Dionaea muscipula]